MTATMTDTETAATGLMEASKSRVAEMLMAQ